MTEKQQQLEQFLKAVGKPPSSNAKAKTPARTTGKAESFQNFRKAVSPTWTPSPKQTYTQKQQQTRGTFENDMVQVDKAIKLPASQRSLVRSFLYEVRASSFSEARKQELIASAISKAKQGQWDDFKKGSSLLKKQNADERNKAIAKAAKQRQLELEREYAASPEFFGEEFPRQLASVQEDARRKSFAEDPLGKIAEAQALITPALQGARNVVRDTAQYAMRNQPNARSENESELALRVLSTLANEPASVARASITRDFRTPLETSPNQNAVEQVLNLVAPMLLPGAGSLGSRMALAAATDVPGIAVGAKDSGGLANMAANMLAPLPEGASEQERFADTLQKYVGLPLLALGAGAGATKAVKQALGARSPKPTPKAASPNPVVPDVASTPAITTELGKTSAESSTRSVAQKLPAKAPSKAEKAKAVPGIEKAPSKAEKAKAVIGIEKAKAVPDIEKAPTTAKTGASKPASERVGISRGKTPVDIKPAPKGPKIDAYKNVQDAQAAYKKDRVANIGELQRIAAASLDSLTRPELESGAHLAAVIRADVHTKYRKELSKPEAQQDGRAIQVYEGLLNDTEAVAQKARTVFNRLGVSLQGDFDTNGTFYLTRRVAAVMDNNVPEKIAKKVKQVGGDYDRAIAKKEAGEAAAVAEAKAIAQSRTTNKKTGRKKQTGSNIESDVPAATPYRVRKAISLLRQEGFDTVDVDARSPGAGLSNNKQRGAVNIPLRQWDNKKSDALLTVVRHVIKDVGFTNMDQLVSDVQTLVPSVGKEHVLSSLSDEYRLGWLESNAQNIKAQRLMVEARLEAQRAQSAAYQNALRALGDFAVSGMRSLRAGADLSAPFIQGLPGLFMFPKRWLQSWKPMLQGLKGGQEMADKLMAELQMHPKYKRAIGDGLDLTSNIAGQQEELFSGGLIDAMKKSKVPGVKQWGIVLEKSDAAYTAFLNHMRFNAYLDITTGGPDDYNFRRDAADFVNVMSGRGVGKVARVIGKGTGGQLSGALIWAPRYKLSGFQLLFTPVRKTRTKAGYYTALSKWSSLVGGAAGLVAFAQMAGATVEYDPRSQRFMWITLPGGRQVGILSRIAEPLRLFAQLLYGKESTTGTFKAADEYQAFNVYDYLQNIGSPVMSTMQLLTTGKQWDSKNKKMVDATMADVLLNSFAPLSLVSASKTAQGATQPQDNLLVALDLIGLNQDEANKTPPKSRPTQTAMPPGLLRIIKATRKQIKEGKVE